MKIAKSIVPMPVYANTAVVCDEIETQVKAANLHGPYLAQVSLMTMMNELVQRRHALLQLEEFDGFARALSSCKLGFVKEAATLSTSASVGCALNFSALPCVNNEVGLVFNFGTGGGKVTFFQTNEGRLQVICDMKPRDAAPNPNSSTIGDYVPKNPKCARQDAKDMMSFVSQIREHVLARKFNVQWMAIFVTGPAREFYYQAYDEAERSKMDLAIMDYMQPIRELGQLSVLKGTLFLRQDIEAEYENKACDAMYGALALTNPEFSRCVVVPDTSCGMGRGSAQVFLGLMTSFGMNALESKTASTNELSCTMQRHLGTQEGKAARDEFVANVNRIIAQNMIPVIPCKSGFALLMDDAKYGSDMLHVAFARTLAMQARENHKKHKLWKDVVLSVEHLASHASDLQSKLWYLEATDVDVNSPQQQQDNVHGDCVNIFI